MTMETVSKVIAKLGAADIDGQLEVALVDGILSAFQEQDSEGSIMLDGFEVVVNALGKSCISLLETSVPLIVCY